MQSNYCPKCPFGILRHRVSPTMHAHSQQTYRVIKLIEEADGKGKQSKWWQILAKCRRRVSERDLKRERFDKMFGALKLHFSSIPLGFDPRPNMALRQVSLHEFRWILNLSSNWNRTISAIVESTNRCTQFSPIRIGIDCVWNCVCMCRGSCQPIKIQFYTEIKFSFAFVTVPAPARSTFDFVRQFPIHTYLVPLSSLQAIAIHFYFALFQ